MAKPVGNIVKGVGNAVAGLFGVDTSPPDLPPVPPAPPAVPVTPVTPKEATKARDAMQDPRRVGRRQTIKTGPRGVMDDESSIEYTSLLGGTKKKQNAQASSS